jgi:hypothetical protein
VRVVKPDNGEPVAERHRQPGGTRLPSGFTTIRDVVSFVAGMAIIGNEVFLSPVVELYAMGVGLALCGLPLVLGADERRGPLGTRKDSE